MGSAKPKPRPLPKTALVLKFCREPDCRSYAVPGGMWCKACGRRGQRRV